MLRKTAQWVLLYLLIVAFGATSSRLTNKNTSAILIPQILKNLYPANLIHGKDSKGISEKTMPVKLNTSYVTQPRENGIKANRNTVTYLPTVTKQDNQYTNLKDTRNYFKNIIRSKKTLARTIEQFKANMTNTGPKIATTLKPVPKPTRQQQQQQQQQQHKEPTKSKENLPAKVDELSTSPREEIIVSKIKNPFQENSTIEQEVKVINEGEGAKSMENVVKKIRQHSYNHFDHVDHHGLFNVMDYHNDHHDGHHGFIQLSNAHHDGHHGFIQLSNDFINDGGQHGLSDGFIHNGLHTIGDGFVHDGGVHLHHDLVHGVHLEPHPAIVQHVGIIHDHHAPHAVIEHSLHHWPWHMSIQEEHLHGWYHLCHGAMIGHHSVLTTAECVYHKPLPSLRVVRHNLIDKVITLNNSSYITARIIHPKYSHIHVLEHTSHPHLHEHHVDDHNLAVLHLHHDMGVHPIGLHHGSYHYDEDHDHGHMECAAHPHASAHFISNANCDFHFLEHIGSSHVCAYGLPCDVHHHHGSPLVCAHDGHGVSLVGLSSYQGSCGHHHPTVYERIAPHTDWITSHIK